MEQFSLKTNWRLSRRCFTTKAVRMRHTESTRKGREVIRLGPAPLGEDTEEEVGCTDSEILPGEWEVQPTSHIRHLNLGVHHREDRTLELFWKPVGWNRRTVRNLHSIREECAHACLLSGTRGRKYIETTQDSSLSPVTNPAHDPAWAGRRASALALLAPWCSVQFSLSQSCLTLCDHMDCSTPGFPVHYQVP